MADPILAIAEAVGLEPGMVSRYLETEREIAKMREESRDLDPSWLPITDAWAAREAVATEIVEASTCDTFAAMVEHLDAAVMAGELHWPFPRWLADTRERDPSRPMPERLDYGDDGAEPPYDPAALEAVLKLSLPPEA